MGSHDIPQAVATQTPTAAAADGQMGSGNVSGKVCVCDDAELAELLVAVAALSAGKRAAALASIRALLAAMTAGA
jgi:hypothetical protein